MSINLNFILRTFVLAFVFFACSKGYGQSNGSIGYLEWWQGSIVLTDGTTSKGLIKYNDNIGQIFFDDGSEVLSFTAEKVKGFEFYDNQMNRQRIFYALHFDGSYQPLFFELLKEFKNFTVLSKHDPVSFKHQRRRSTPVYGPYLSGGSSTNPAWGRASKVLQTEIICIKDTTGNIKSYTSIQYSDKGDESFKVMDEGLLEEMVGAIMYEKLKVYATKNGLEFGKKNDLIRILDYYGELINY